MQVVREAVRIIHCPVRHGLVRPAYCILSYHSYLPPIILALLFSLINRVIASLVITCYIPSIPCVSTAEYQKRLTDFLYDVLLGEEMCRGDRIHSLFYNISPEQVE